MINLSFLQPIIKLLQDETVREKIDETARIYFSSDLITINLLPALIILALASLLLLPLLGIPILDILGNSMASLTGGSGHGGGAGTGYGYVSRIGDESYYDQTIAELQHQVTSLQENEASLRSAVYYNSPVGEGAQDSNSIAYSS